MSEQVSIEDIFLKEIAGRIEKLIDEEDREYEEVLIYGNGDTPRMGIIGVRSHGVATDGAEPTDRPVGRHPSPGGTGSCNRTASNAKIHGF